MGDAHYVAQICCLGERHLIARTREFHEVSHLVVKMDSLYNPPFGLPYRVVALLYPLALNGCIMLARVEGCIGIPLIHSKVCNKLFLMLFGKAARIRVGDLRGTLRTDIFFPESQMVYAPLKEVHRFEITH